MYWAFWGSPTQIPCLEARDISNLLIVGPNLLIQFPGPHFASP